MKFIATIIYLVLFGTNILSAEGVNKAALSSLRFVYYLGNPTPPPPSKNEMAAAVEKLKKIRGEERKILAGHLGGDPFSMALAMRDLDGDGIRDYRIDESSGKFMEGDVDVDNDGIRNVLDSHPYNPKFGGADLNKDGQPDRKYRDVNNNTIPDHVDWCLSDKSAEMCRIQKLLYQRHKIILIERTQKYTTTMARATRDTIAVVFQNIFAPSIPTLRTIASEARVHLKPEQDEGVSAMMIPQTQTIWLYRDALVGKPVVVLALLVHEVAHAIQFNFDFNAKKMNFENKRLLTVPKKYFSYLGKYGWKFKPATSKGKQPFRSIVGVWRESRPFSEYYRKKHLNQWQRWLNDLYEKHGYAFLRKPEVKKTHFVSPYAASDLFEWHSEMVMSTVLQGMVDSSTGSSRKSVMGGMYKDIHSIWPSLYFNNIEDSYQYGSFLKEFNLTKSKLRYLGRSYVRK